MINDDKPYWYPTRTDEDWCNEMRERYPEKTEGWNDEQVRDYYANGNKYHVVWDHVGDAYDDYEKLADAFLESLGG